LTDIYIMTSLNRHTPNTSIIDRQLNVVIQLYDTRRVTAWSNCDVKHY